MAVEGTARDISERIDAHERLRRSEERLRAMLDRVDILAVAIDRDGTITFANPWLCRLTGRTPEELLGRDWFDTCVPADERDGARATWSTVFEVDGTPARFDTGLIASDGGTRRINWSPAPILDAAGRPSGCVALGDDVTASREARALERRLSAAVEQTAESVVITDVEGRILYVNPAFERVSGYRRDEVIGQTPRVIQSGFQDEHFYERMWASLTAGETWTGELVNRAKDGRTYVEEASITPIRDGAGAITNYVAVKRDVTRERQVDALLAASREERLQVARIVAGFEPADTPEATGAAIVAAVQALPDIAAAWIVTFDPDGAATVLAGTPAPFPADHVGHVLPPERANVPAGPGRRRCMGCTLDAPARRREVLRGRRRGGPHGHGGCTDRQRGADRAPPGRRDRSGRRGAPGAAPPGPPGVRGGLPGAARARPPRAPAGGGLAGPDRGGDRRGGLRAGLPADREPRDRGDRRVRGPHPVLGRHPTRSRLRRGPPGRPGARPRARLPCGLDRGGRGAAVGGLAEPQRLARGSSSPTAGSGPSSTSARGRRSSS